MESSMRYTNISERFSSKPCFLFYKNPLIVEGPSSMHNLKGSHTNAQQRQEGYIANLEASDYANLQPMTYQPHEDWAGEEHESFIKARYIQMSLQPCQKDKNIPPKPIRTMCFIQSILTKHILPRVGFISSGFFMA